MAQDPLFPPTSAPRWKRHLALGLVVLAAASCQPNLLPGSVTILSGDGTAMPTASTVTVGLQVREPFAAQAVTPRTTGQVHHYTVKLYNWSGSVLAGQVHSHSTSNNTNMTVNFSNVPPGTYKVTAEAFSSPTDVTSITQGGAQESTNTVTVAYGSLPVYAAPDTSKLTVSLQLLNGVGDNVNNTLNINNGRPASDAGLAPDDFNPATTIHDYTVIRNAVTSTFVWLPRFTAIQLMVPSNCGTVSRFGTADNLRPTGFWVDGTLTPNAGTPGTDWVKEDFGGFYVGKYEASHQDAAFNSAGTAPILAVQQNVVPWTLVAWDQAALKCREFHPAGHLMTDDEWTALAVHAMINNVTVRGNNNNGTDADTGGVMFTSDSTQVGRTTTGSGPTSTSHTGTSSGVYDLHGNVAEWTASVSRVSASGAWIIDGVDTGQPSPTSGTGISSLVTHPLLRRYGLPGPGTANPAFGNDTLSAGGSGVATKMIRGGSYTDGANAAGLWRVQYNNSRTTNNATIGFRPVLRF